MTGLLEVRVTSAAAADEAARGGADRVLLARPGPGGDLGPWPEEVAQARQATDCELRVLVRLREGYSTDGGEATRLRGLTWAYRQAGADGLVLGFLNGYGEVDSEVVAALTEEGDWPWSFDRAFDCALDRPRAWAALVGLPRLDTVLTAGSARGLEQGLDQLIEEVGQPGPAELAMAAGGLVAEQVPWLVRGGLRRFQVGDQPSADGVLAADQVSAWRRLIDAEVDRAESRRGSTRSDRPA
ncbi:MAG: copper homeostasis protein CutC [Propionibacteriaceae bacterium]|jgi:copper homeostasis protein|nr:copper homeostasis protein CutC [Propionibacteriaceae bacterium]